MAAGTTNYTGVKVSCNLQENILLFKNIFKKDAILRMKQIKTEKLSCAVFYMDGMVNIALLNDSIIRPLVMIDAVQTEAAVADYVAKQILFASEISKTSSVEDIIRSILYGDTLLLIDGTSEALTINTKGWRTRGISEPEDERILQGPREGFDEAALLNVAMIRRKLLTPDLCVEMQRMGRRTDTLIFICYLDSLADPKTVSELKKRLSKIDMDGILDSNYISEQIRDSRSSLFKTTGTTERPDIVAARLLEGRIALVVDGTPVVVTLPYLFCENFQSDEDYYLNYMIASVGRVLRYVCFFIAISAPAVFIALLTLHKQLLPTTFALSVAQLRGGVPFPTVAECIVLILVFQVLKESGVRMPQSLGHALSIVGGLVVGQAAVEARIISAPMLIAVALSGICGLMIPRMKAAVFFLQMSFVIISAFFGLYGYFAALSVVLIKIFTMESFGVDYTIPLRRITVQSLKDTFWRAPWTMMKKRPAFNHNIKRSGDETKK